MNVVCQSHTLMLDTLQCFFVLVFILFFLNFWHQFYAVGKLIYRVKCVEQHTREFLPECTEGATPPLCYYILYIYPLLLRNVAYVYGNRNTIFYFILFHEMHSRRFYRKPLQKKIFFFYFHLCLFTISCIHSTDHSSIQSIIMYLFLLNFFKLIFFILSYVYKQIILLWKLLSLKSIYY